MNNTAGGDASFASGELNATGTSYMNTIRLSDSDIKYIDELQGNDGLKFKGNVQSSTQMILTEDGKLGIGNLTPNALLDVAGDIRFTGQLYDSEGLFEPSKWEENGDAIFYSNGNVGIGTNTPNGKLNIKTGNADWITLSTTQNNYWKIRNSANQDGLYFGYTNSSTNQTQWKILTINNNGQVGIGTSTHETDSKFTVNGKIHAQEVKVTTDAGADFVFNDNYDLPELSDVESFITENKHLPDIPSAEEMKENGLEIGDMQIKLLQKVEELTLYIIELKKEHEDMKKQMERKFSKLR